MKISRIFLTFAAATWIVGLMPLTSLAQIAFLDVSETTKYHEAIYALANSGVIRGYPDSTFKPSDPLRRAEIVQLILQAEEKTIDRNLSPCFTDVRDRNEWYFNPVCTGKKIGMALGYPDSSFKPGNTVTRAEAVALLCRVQKWELSEGFSAPFNDVPESAWFAPCIAYAKSAGYLADISQKSKTFFPGNPMKRGVFSELLYESLKAKNSPVLSRTATPEPLFMENGVSPEGVTAEVTEIQQEMLELVNRERVNRGFQSVSWSDELAGVAQGHSNDMVARSFFDHINPDGESPDDRRTEDGITTLVGENLAKAPSLESAHEGLMNSPPHRANILDPEWERMGVGIAKDADGYLLFTQLFSTLPITQNDFQETENRLIQKINAERSKNALPALEISTALAETAVQWSEKMARERFFSMEAADGETLLGIMQENVSATFYQATIFQTNQLSEALDDTVLSDPVYINTRLRRAGLGFSVDETGFVKLTILYTD